MHFTIIIIMENSLTMFRCRQSQVNDYAQLYTLIVHTHRVSPVLSPAPLPHQPSPPMLKEKRLYIKQSIATHCNTYMQAALILNQ